MTQSILLVEDNEDDVFFLKRAMTKGGLDHSVHLVQDGRQALDYLQGVGKYADRAQSFKIVLLDMQMPAMNGIEVLEQIMKDETLRKIPVVMVSGVDEMANVTKCIETGAADYLQKPIDPASLRARIDNCLEKKSAH